MSARVVELRGSDNYYEQLLDVMCMNKCRGVGTPYGSVPPNMDKRLEPLAHARYRTIVGKVLWLARRRPDLSFIAKEMGRSVSSPTEGDELVARECFAMFR